MDKEIFIVPITAKSRIGGALFTINAHNMEVTCLKWIPSESCLYSGGLDGCIKKWQISEAGAHLGKTLVENVGRIDSMIPMPNIGKVIALINGCLFALINIENAEIVKALPFKADAKKGYSMLCMEKRREIFIGCSASIDIWTLGDL